MKTFYNILTCLIYVGGILTFLWNTWWCLFIANYSTPHLWFWWAMVSVALLFGGAGAILFIGSLKDDL